MDTFLLSILTFYLVLAPALKITEFRMPTKVKAETNVTLDCLYDLEGDALYSVKWYKDDVEFYRFMPSSVPQRSLFAVDGITARFTEDRNSSVLLNNVSQSASGTYRCEIFGGAPSFATAADSEDLLVAEPPDPPRHLTVVETTSRSATLSWTKPKGIDVIRSYEIQHNEHETNWNVDTVNSTVPGEQTSVVVSDLEPFTTYYFRVLAETTLGMSRASDPVKATTSGEAPNGPPVNVSAQALGLQSVKVTWKAPSKDLHYGIIRGYYIGYQPAATSPRPYTFEAVDNGEHESGEIILTELQPSTRYVVIVQAFNDHGTGPRSEEIFVETLDSVPPTPPQLSVLRTSGTSVTLEWEQHEKDMSPVKGYHVFHTKADSIDQWKETVVPGSQHSLVIDKLSCGSTYWFAICAYNDAGTGNISDAVIIKTDGSRPVAPPDTRPAVIPRQRSAVIETSYWHDGGCPIESFTALLTTTTGGVHSYQWHVEPAPPDAQKPYDEPLLEIRGLLPARTYKVLLTAYNSAGSTMMQYVFTTFTDNAKKPHKIHVPPLALLNGAVRLHCSHGFGNEAAHSVMWFKDGDEFYRYVPADKPSAKAFIVEGVNVNMLESNASSVYLEMLEKSTAGTYSCEVSSETPSSRSTAEGELVIIERLPATPHVSISIVDETVELKCSGARSEPSPTLSLLINDQLANSMTVLESHPDGLPTVTVRTTLEVGRDDAERGHIRVRCAAAYSDALVATVEESIYVESPRWLLSRASPRRDQCTGKTSNVFNKM